jgi:hypothetical protein
MALNVGIKTDFGNYGIKSFDTGMTKAPEEPWEKRWNTFQVNPYAMLKWFKTPTLDRFLRQLGEQAWYEWGLSENTPSTLTIGEILKIGDPMRDIPGVQSLMDVNTPGSWANLFAKAEGLRRLMESMGMPSAQQAFQGFGLGSGGTIDIRLPDYSEALKKLEERGKGIYETERGRILEDLSKMRETSLSDIERMRETSLSDIERMRELTYSDLNRLLGMDVWEQPIRQAEEIGRREAMRFMDVAGLGGLGAAPLLMSEIVQKATQPLLVEKARGQQALMEMAQRGLQEIGLTGLRGLQEIGLTGLRGLQEQSLLAQRGLQELGAGFTEYMYGLPFSTFEQALREAQFKYSTAFRLFDLQLEPYRIILGAQSREVPPPGFFEDLSTYLSSLI